MAFEVETGTGSTTSNSYVSVASADAYHLLYGNTDWPTGTDDATVAQKQTWLVQGTQAIDLIFGPDYKSQPFSLHQALLFPRFPFYINRYQLVQSSAIPIQLQDAVCEAALIACNGGSLNPDFSAISGVTSSRIKVDVIEKAVTYSGETTAERYTGFLKIERLLMPVLRYLDERSITFLSR